eukprot:jgi/Botrbrau1/14542/Bobra.0212s0009.1
MGANKHSKKRVKLQAAASCTEEGNSPMDSELFVTEDLPQGVRVRLAMGQVVLFSGQAKISVEGAALDLMGATVEALAPPLEVHAELAGDGEPLPIRAKPPASLQVPHSPAQAAVFCVRPLSQGTLGTGSFPHRGGGQDGAAGAPGETAASTDVQIPEAGFRIWWPTDDELESVRCVPPQWEEVIQMLLDEVGQKSRARAPVIAVCGSKGVGKSTFGRLLMNRLLPKTGCVAFLDTDCGQPEFTVPGLVSLSLVEEAISGLPHEHLRRPWQAIFVGDISPQTDPLRYIKAVQQLYSSWCQEVQTWPGPCPPLLINTNGWIKGIGYDTLCSLLQSVALTHVLLLQTFADQRNLEARTFWQDGGAGPVPPPPPPAILQIPAIAQPDVLPNQGASPGCVPPGEQKRVSGPEARSLLWLAYWRSCLGQPPTVGGWGAPAFAAVATGLVHERPFQIRRSDIQISILHSWVHPSEQLRAVNGALVGLLRCPEHASPRKEHDAAVGGRDAEDQLPQCLGIGIVRSVDVSRGLLYILTPILGEELEEVGMLQLGRLELPAQLLQAGPFTSPYLRESLISAEGTGAGIARSRNNLIRASQL